MRAAVVREAPVLCTNLSRELACFAAGNTYAKLEQTVTVLRCQQMESQVCQPVVMSRSPIRAPLW